MRPFDTTATLPLLLYNIIYHFTLSKATAATRIQYNYLKTFKKNDILAYCKISISNTVRQHDAYATLSHHCKPSPFTLQYAISFFLACLWYSTSNTYSAPPRIHTITWKLSKKRHTCLLHIFNHPIPYANMMPMRPSDTTANPLILLYNIIYHFTSLVFDILPYCIISITQSHRPIWCICDPLSHHCKTSPFTLYYNISFYLACLWHSTSNTYSAAHTITWKLSKKTTYLLTA